MTGTQLTTYDEKWAAMAKEFVTQVPQAMTADRLSTKGGVFSLDGAVLGTRLVAIILDSIAVNTYYSGTYQEGGKDAPRCYAYGRPPEEMHPHLESMSLHREYFRPQNMNPATGEIGGCVTCPMNVFGTDPKGGRGKACQNRQTLALLPAGKFVQQGYSVNLELFDDPNWFRDADIVKASLPPTALADYGEYVRKVAASCGRPPFGVITVIELQPHQKNQVQWVFTMVETIPNHLFDTVIGRHTQARDTMVEPFSPPKASEQQQQPIQNLQRQVTPPQTAQFNIQRR